LNVSPIPEEVSPHADVGSEDRRHETDEREDYAEDGQELADTRLLEQTADVGRAMNGSERVVGSGQSPP
jgi:hypothetical protein